MPAPGSDKATLVSRQSKKAHVELDALKEGSVQHVQSTIGSAAPTSSLLGWSQEE